MAQRQHRWIVISLVAVVVALVAGGVAAWAIQENNRDASNSLAAQPSVKTLEIKPHRIDTSDALTRYVQGLSGTNFTKVSENHIYYASDVDWNNDTLVALQFPLLEGKTVNKYGIETIGGVEKYVIDVTDVQTCTDSHSIDSLRVVFIKQAGQDTDKPVILRITPNTADCRNFEE